jgi:hypothetical protein
MAGMSDMVQSSMRISLSLTRFCSSTGKVGLETRGVAAGVCAGGPGGGYVWEVMVEKVFRAGFGVVSEIVYLCNDASELLLLEISRRLSYLHESK